MLPEDERLVLEIEAELWAASSNPIAQFIGIVRRFFMAVFGFRKKGFLVVTNQRLMEVYDQINCYCLNTSREIKNIPLNSVKEIGYRKKTTCGFFCPAYYLYYEGITQATEIQLRDCEEMEAQKTVNAFYRAVNRREQSW
jgi:hypothetical protein